MTAEKNNFDLNPSEMEASGGFEQRPSQNSHQQPIPAFNYAPVPAYVPMYLQPQPIFYMDQFGQFFCLYLLPMQQPIYSSVHQPAGSSVYRPNPRYLLKPNNYAPSVDKNTLPFNHGCIDYNAGVFQNESADKHKLPTICEYPIAVDSGIGKTNSTDLSQIEICKEDGEILSSDSFEVKVEDDSIVHDGMKTSLSQKEIVDQSAVAAARTLPAIIQERSQDKSNNKGRWRFDRFGQILTDENHCQLCKSNREPVEVYMNHLLRNSNGNVECPILRAFICPICQATGDDAHTLKYCPTNVNGSSDQAVQMRDKTLRYRRVRNSTGHLHSLKY